MPPEFDIIQLIESVRAEAGPQLVSARQQAETEARAYLDNWAGRMDRDKARELGKLLNRHYWGTGVRNNRFMPGMSTPLIDQMTVNVDHFNQIVGALWRGEIEAALDQADRVFREPTYLPGAGQSFPSMLLYLRDRERFAVWFKGLDRALAAVSDYGGHDRAAGRTAYLDFCNHVLAVRLQYGLAPEEMDAILAEADRQTIRVEEEYEEAALPTITRAAFQFLADLAMNNSKEWFEANRGRYEKHVRDPVADVLEAVADRYIRSLDPKLNTVVKRDEVLARINKYTSGDPYYLFYWGAFSRGKKQEDIQLYMNVNSEHIHFGLHIGSASDASRIALIDGLERLDDEFIEAVNEQIGEPSWSPDDRRTIDVATKARAIEWAKGPAPHLRRIIKAEDPLIGSQHLVGEIGRVLSAVHPLALLGWGEQFEFERPEPEEGARPAYPFDQLVVDTSLPAEQLDEWIELLQGEKRAALFYGPPGTGKTFVVERIARYLAGTDGETRTVQFHPSFSYEDFIEGLRPVTNSDGHMSYETRAGVFREFCDRARGKDSNYVFVVDEINRAELGSVLGEVMMLIEYRGKTIPLPYSQEGFSVPPNIVLLATMNTADRSLALVDFALRRRFHAFRMLPNRDVLAANKGAEADLALKMFDLVQEYVDNEAFAPGHSYWMVKDVSAIGLQRIWSYEIQPYLQEYWFESRSRLDDLEKAIVQLLAEGA